MNTKFALVFAAVALVSTSACAKKQKDLAMTDAVVVEQTAEKRELAQPTAVATTEDDDSNSAPIYFAFDSHDLSSDARAELNRVANALKKNEAATLRIEGHTDDRGTTEYNLALGERRASAARDYLKRLGVETDRVRVVSYGEERPAVAGDDESAWSNNRRDEFYVMR